MPDVIRVNDATSRDELIEALGHLAHAAQRLPHVVGNNECPTPWDLRHRAIDELLDLLAASR